jgi:hypothetical protein
MGRAPFLGEGLLAPGVIRLFGREFTGLKLTKDEGFNPTSNNPLVLQDQISVLAQRPEATRTEQPAAAAAEPAQAPAGEEEKTAVPEESPFDPSDREARLARIYGFSYLGAYYKVPNPPVLRVYGTGFPVRSGYQPDNHMDILGVEFKDEDFVQGIRMWPADQLDVAVRIDITIGWLREILLDTDMSQDTNVTSNSNVSRADVVGRDSGLVGRDSGLVGRDSGFVGRSRR